MVNLTRHYPVILSLVGAGIVAFENLIIATGMLLFGIGLWFDLYLHGARRQGSKRRSKRMEVP